MEKRQLTANTGWIIHAHVAAALTTYATGPFWQDVVESSDVGTALKLLDVDPIKAAAGEIVRAGAALHEALGGEATNRDARARALAALPGADEVEAAITEALAGEDGHGSCSRLVVKP
jgi:hypothetical protein